MALNQQERAVLDALAQSGAAMVELLRELVNIDSGSYDKAGVDAVQAVLHEHLAEHGIPCEVHPNATYGNCTSARVNAANGSNDRPAVLMGHCDTVFPKGTVAQRPFRIAGDLAYGPGVADMKGGLVINTFVLETFARLGAPVPLVGLYTADEEIASPSSRAVIESVTQGARAVLNGEPGRPTGNVVTGRKGALFLDIEVTGKPAHSGVNHREGVSAIEALCRKVIRLHALTDYEAGTTVNVGTIGGGSSVNTVADHAKASVDVRFTDLETMALARAKVLDIVERSELQGSTARVVKEGSFLPLTQSAASKALFETYAAGATDLGFRVEGEFTGGSADSGLTAAAGIPTLCATGPVGAKPHTPDEYLDLRTIVPRAQAIALTILRL
jgi:glutamate carboxypeptidase